MHTKHAKKSLLLIFFVKHLRTSCRAHFGKTFFRVIYLGLLITLNVDAINQQKVVVAIHSTPPLKNVKLMQSFLLTISRYR